MKLVRLAHPRRIGLVAVIALIVAGLAGTPAALADAPGGATVTVGGTATTTAPGSGCTYTIPTTATTDYVISSADANYCLQGASTLTVVNNSGDVFVDGSTAAISGTGTLSLNANGDVSSSSGTVSVGNLTGTAQNGFSLSKGVQVTSLGPITASLGIAVSAHSAMTVSGTLATQTGNISLASTGALTLNASINAAPAAGVSLSGASVVEPGGSLDATTVTVDTTFGGVRAVGGDITLSQTSNAFNYFEATAGTAGDVTLTDSRELELSDTTADNLTVTAPGGAFGSNDTANAFDMSGSSAEFYNVVLGDVTGTVTGSALLSGAISGLGSSTSGLSAESLSVTTTSPVQISNTVSASHDVAALDAHTTSVTFAPGSNFSGGSGSASVVYTASREADSFASTARLGGKTISTLTGTEFANSSTEQWNASSSDFGNAENGSTAILLYANQGTASTSLDVTPASSAPYGTAVTMKATVTPGGGTGTLANPTGNVAFSFGSQTPCTVPLTSVANSTTSTATCTVSSNPAAANYSLSASYSADSSTAYASSTSGNVSYTVTPAAQTITFATAPSSQTVGGSYHPSATGGGSTEPVTYTVDPSSSAVCSYTAGTNTVSFDHVGTCVVDANQAGDSNYTAAAQAQQSVPVGAAAQAINFGSGPSTGTVGGSYQPSATGGASGKPVTFSIDNASAGVCSYDSPSNTVSFLHAGSCVVDANQAGNSDYTAAPQTTQTTQVGMASQTIVFGAGPSASVVGGSYQPSASGGASGRPVTFTVDSSASGVCTYTSGTNTVSFDHAGTCVVDANQAGNSDYSAAPQQQQSFTVGKGSQTITVTSTPPASPTVGGSYPVSASASSGLAVSYSIDHGASNPADACSISGAVVSFDHAGTCVIDVDQAGNDDYTAASTASQTVVVGTTATSVSVATTPNSTVYGQSVTATAVVSASNSGSAYPAGSVQFAVDGTPIGSVVAAAGGSAAGDTVTSANLAPLTSGAHTVTAVFTPTDSNAYDSGQGSTQLAIDHAATGTMIAVRPSSIIATVTPRAPGSGTPSGVVTFTVRGANVGTAHLVHGVATLAYRVPTGGTATVAAAYAGDANFAGSSASTARRDPTITARVFSTHGTSRYGWYRTPVTVSFTCATHGAPLTGHCPRSVTLTRNGAGQSVTRTVTATDGGAATAAARGIDIDRTAPSVAVRGITDGGVYDGSAPRASCVASDRTSGIAACRLTTRRTSGAVGYTVTYTATATDKAGNTRTTGGRYRVDTLYLAGAQRRSGAYQVRTGHTYTLVVVGTGHRPVFYDAAAYPRTPDHRGSAFRSAGHDRWVLGVTILDNLRTHPAWNLGVRIGDTVHTVKIHVSR